MIAVDGLTKRYEERAAVDGVTFEVGRGRIAGFVGPNGAGKSTTMRMMLGLTRPDAGQVRYGGIALSELAHPARVVGAVLDPQCMHPGRTARNHLRATSAIAGIPEERVDDVLREVGLASAADRRAGGFSLGMRQRLALAGALLGSPGVLLLDEPSNGLDPDGIRWLRAHLRSFADDGGTVLVSSHLIGELARFADDVIVVGGGRLLAAESLESITARSERTVVVDTAAPSVLAQLLRTHDIVHEVDGDRLLVRGVDPAVVSQLAFDHQIRLDGIAESATSLEDLLLELTRGSLEFAPDAAAPLVQLTEGAAR